MNKSFPAQVSAVFDTTGLIHPQWCRFRNSDGELIKIESIIVENATQSLIEFIEIFYVIHV